MEKLGFITVLFLDSVNVILGFVITYIKYLIPIKALLYITCFIFQNYYFTFSFSDIIEVQLFKSHFTFNGSVS